MIVNDDAAIMMFNVIWIKQLSMGDSNKTIKKEQSILPHVQNHAELDCPTMNGDSCQGASYCILECLQINNGNNKKLTLGHLHYQTDVDENYEV